MRPSETTSSSAAVERGVTPLGHGHSASGSAGNEIPRDVHAGTVERAIAAAGDGALPEVDRSDEPEAVAPFDSDFGPTLEVFSSVPNGGSDRLPSKGTDRVRNALALVRLLSLVTAGFAVGADGSNSGTIHVVWLAVLVVMTILRLIYPLSLRSRPERSSALPQSLAVQLAAETALVTAAILTTGYWSSVFLVFLLAPVTTAGLLLRQDVAFTLAFVPPSVVFFGDVVTNGLDPNGIRDSTTWFAVLGLIASASGNLKRMAEDGASTRLGPPRRTQLEAANDLLTSLHQIAQKLPASLDIGEVLDSTAGRIRSVVPVDTLAILLDDGLPNQLSVAFSSGTALGDQIDRTRLSAAAMSSAEAGLPWMDPDLHNGLSGRSRSAIYLPLTARSSRLGLIVIEHKEPGIYNDSELQVLADIATNAGLEVDNARWFARIRTVGADEERNRIARDLHDRIGQALAYLGFELDRLNAKTVSDEELRRGITRLRVDVRTVVQEVRDTLYDLRTEVGDQERLQPVLAKFCSRVAERSGLTITLLTDPELNVGVRQERELWRIAQEAITNVERHARAEAVEVSWARDGDLAILTITDDGQGFTPGRSGRSDSYGLLGMRERASAIGAVLTIEQARNRGTHIRCSLAIDDPRRVPEQTTSGGKGQ